MPLERFYRLPEDKRAQILGVAAAEFAEKGFEAASLNAILATSGLSKGSYYYYFVDKEDLYAEVLEGSFARFQRTLAPLPLDALTAGGFWEAIEAHFREWIRAIDVAPEMVQLFRGMDAARRRSPRFAPLFARLGEMFAGVIDKGRALGCIRTDLPTDALVRLLLALDAALDEDLLAEDAAPGPDRLRRHADLTLDMYRRVLLPPDAIAPRPARPAARKTSKSTHPRRKS